MAAEPEPLVEFTLGEILRTLRHRARKQVKEFSEAMGVSTGTIMRWEHSDGVPPLSAVFRLARLAEETGLAGRGQGMALLERGLRVSERRRASTSTAGRAPQEIRGVNLAFLPLVPEHVPRHDHRFHGRRIIQR